MVFCFVVGTDLGSAFEVEGDARTSISIFKEKIYEKNKNDFNNQKFDANKLILWKVDIPYDKKNAKLKTLQSRSDMKEENNIIQELGGEELSPVDDIGDIFKDDSDDSDDSKKIKKIRIIVQPPPPATTAGPSQGFPQGPNWTDASSIYEWIQQFTLKRGRNRLVASFGQEFEFCGRDDAINTLWNGDEARNGIVGRFKNRNQRDKENHPIPVIACGPGTGKSRFLDEIEELLIRNVDSSDDEDIRNAFKNMVVINTTYGNGSVASIEDDLVIQTASDRQVISAHMSIAMRILYEYFRPQHDYGEFSFSDFRSLCKKDSTISGFTLNTALQVVRTDTIKQKKINSNDLLVLVLGIDEFNKLHFERENSCKELVNYIGGAMLDLRNIFFIPILAGTIEGPLEKYITESRHKQLRLPLYLLDMGHTIGIGKAMGLIDDDYVKLHPYFRVSIGDIGGHVRTLEYFYEFFEKCMGNDKDPYKVEISHIIKQVESKVSGEYGLSRYSKWLSEVMAKAILNLSIKKEDKINLEDELTDYSKLSSMGLISLVLAEDRISFYIRIPYLWISILVKSSKKSGFDFWRSMFDYDEPMFWQNFEKFNAQFWALRLSLFRILGYKKIDLRKLLRGARISSEFPAGKVILPKKVRICGLRHRYPAKGNNYGGTKMNTDDDKMDKMDTDDDEKGVYKTKDFDRYYTRLDHPNPKDNHIVYINACGSKYDAFEFLKFEQHSNENEMDSSNENEMDSSNEIEMDRLCVALQMKKREPKNSISQTQFDDEHKKVIEAMEYTEETNWILLFLTNGNASLNIEDKKNSALVTVKEFGEFYGYTYANRAQFASANEKLYINSISEENLPILGFTEKESNEICTKRKASPFTDYDDIKTRIQSKKVLKLKHDDRIVF